MHTMLTRFRGKHPLRRGDLSAVLNVVWDAAATRIVYHLQV